MVERRVPCAIEEARATADEAGSLASMRQAGAIMMNDNVILPRYHRNNDMMMGPHMQGCWRSSLNIPYLGDVTISD